MMLSISWRLTILSGIVVPPILILSMTYGRFVSRLSKLAQTYLGRASDISTEAIGNIGTVRAFGAEAREADRHADVLASYYESQVKTAKAYSGFSIVTTFIPTVVIALILYCGGQLVAAGALSGPDLLSVVLYQFSTAASFASLGDIYSGLASAVGAAEKIFALLDREPRIQASGSYIPGTGMPMPMPTPAVARVQEPTTTEPAPAAADADAVVDTAPQLQLMPKPKPKPSSTSADPPTGKMMLTMSVASAAPAALALAERKDAAGASLPVQLPPLPLAPGSPETFAAEIAFHNVTFAYPTRPEVAVLKNFNLHVPASTIVALCGPSGHGKSSIVKLLCRAYEPDRGVITLGGVPLGAFDVSWLRRAISIVGQEPTLFARSVWENVLLGADGAEVTEDAMGGSRALIPFARALGLGLGRSRGAHYSHGSSGGGDAEGDGDGGAAIAARVLAALPHYQQVRAGAHSSSTATTPSPAGSASSMTAWVTDPNTADNVPAIRAAAVLRRRLLQEYRKEARAAVDSLTVHARGRLAALLLQQARASTQTPGTHGCTSKSQGSLNGDTLSASASGLASDMHEPLLAPASRAGASAAAVVVDSSEGRPSLSSSATDVESGHHHHSMPHSGSSAKQLLATVPPEALLSALYPAHAWNAGVPRSSVFPPSEMRLLTRPTAPAPAPPTAPPTAPGSGRSDSSTAAVDKVALAGGAVATGAPVASREEQEKKRLARKLQRARRVREFIRAHRLAESSASSGSAGAVSRVLGLSAEDRALLEQWYPADAARSLAFWPVPAAVAAPDGLSSELAVGAASGDVVPVPVYLNSAGGSGAPGAPGAQAAIDPQSVLAELGYDLGEGGEDDDAGAGAAGAGSGGRGGAGAEDDDDAALGLTPETGATHGLPPLTPTLDTIRRVLAAARVANAAEFVRELPDGFDSVMGEKAGTVSGGQRQRLCIARVRSRGHLSVYYQHHSRC